MNDCGRVIILQNQKYADLISVSLKRDYYEKMEATCKVKIELKFKNKDDLELYKKNLNDIREISGWRAITK